MIKPKFIDDPKALDRLLERLSLDPDFKVFANILLEQYGTKTDLLSSQAALTPSADFVRGEASAYGQVLDLLYRGPIWRKRSVT